MIRLIPALIIVGFAALGAYDGYKTAKKKKLKGWKKVAAIAGRALLGAVNPLKIVKVASKAYKAVKYVKAATNTQKATKVATAVKAKPKTTVVQQKTVKTVSKPAAVKKTTQAATKKAKQVKAACFTAGTKIYTEKGFKAIENIKPGDYVWSENPETNEKALKKVKKIFVREKDSLIRLAINGEAIETTDEHPFYVEGKGFTAAKELAVGDEVRLEDGSVGIVEGTETVTLDNPVKVYNFEVEDFHTYYVSEQKVLVHNTCAVTNKNAKGAAKGVGANKGVANPVKVEGKGSTGRATPNNLNEQMAMHEVQSNPLQGASKVPITMTDPRWPASEGWVKMQRVIPTLKGSKIKIHFNYNKVTGTFDDFKYK